MIIRTVRVPAEKCAIISAKRKIATMAAKPETVLEDEGSLDYYNDVPNQSLPDDFDLADAFGVKVDSPEYEKLNPAGEEHVILS